MTALLGPRVLDLYVTVPVPMYKLRGRCQPAAYCKNGCQGVFVVRMIHHPHFPYYVVEPYLSLKLGMGLRQGYEGHHCRGWRKHTCHFLSSHLCVCPTPWHGPGEERCDMANIDYSSINTILSLPPVWELLPSMCCFFG